MNNDDLISRSALIEFLKEVTVTDGITFETGFKQILTDIKNQPTAYNKEKVMEQLEEMSVGEQSCIDCKYIEECDGYTKKKKEKWLNGYDLCAQVAKYVAIDIVKAGGVNE